MHSVDLLERHAMYTSDSIGMNSYHRMGFDPSGSESPVSQSLHFVLGCGGEPTRFLSSILILAGCLLHSVVS